MSTRITFEMLLDALTSLSVSLVPLGATISRAIENSSKELDAASEKGFDELTQEISKQELRLGFDLKQAKISQELAIAHRIMDAETVEIEEFYDRSGSGQAGLGLNDAGLNVGLRGDGKSVVKRIYKFTGRSVKALDLTAKTDGPPEEPSS